MGEDIAVQHDQIRERAGSERAAVVIRVRGEGRSVAVRSERLR